MNPSISLTLLFFFFFFLISSTILILPLPEVVIAAGDECSPQSCGNVSIEYPFWISGRQPSFCGPPLFEVACRNRTDLPSVPVPVLRLLDSDYYVRDIFYDNGSFQLTSAKFVEDECPFPTNNLTANVYPFALTPPNKRIFFLRNCSTSENTTLFPYTRITCPGSMGYLVEVHEGSDEPKLPESVAGLCKVVVVPTAVYAEGNYSELLRAGWLMNWTAPDCTLCRESGGQCGYNQSLAKFMCICDDRNHREICRYILGGLCGLCLMLLFLLHCRRRAFNQKNDRAVRALLSLHGPSLIPKNYKYSEIRRMTKSLRNKLGQGGYGTVYLGTLRDGRQVAVKLLRTEEASKGNGEEFINEVISISRTSHVNVVSLVGFCMERSKRALVYEFMPNGSLEKFISSDQGGGAGEAPLGWEKLFSIVVGVARGLEYLHRGCSTRIVHFDIKPHNILLDQDFCPKISDFGLAKSCSPKESSGFSKVTPRGTIGYIAPEVFSRNFGTVSSKSDVYSYGMLLLEMVGVRTMKEKKNGHGSSTCSSEVYFPHWIYDRLGGTSNFLESTAGDLGTPQEEEMVRKMVIVGLWCIQTMPVNRPSMSTVVDMLEGSTQDLEIPPKP